jgi:hypothetical protein
MTITYQSTSDTTAAPVPPTGVTTTADPTAGIDPQQRPVQQVHPVSTLADQLERTARALRAGVALGLTDPPAIVVTAAGECAVELPTPDLIAWSRQYPRRPRLTTFRGSAYLACAGEIGGQTWHLRNGAPAPAEPDRATWGSERDDALHAVADVSPDEVSPSVTDGDAEPAGLADAAAEPAGS